MKKAKAVVPPIPMSTVCHPQGDILEVPETVARSGVQEAAAEVVSAQRCPDRPPDPYAGNRSQIRSGGKTEGESFRSIRTAGKKAT